MCNRPIKTLDRNTGAEITFACRKCDECISTRKNDWIARAMAEKAQAEFCHVLTLTYRDTINGKPDPARAFKYQDVQTFLKLIRYHAGEKYGKGVELRYICCGERGSQKNRVHWHIILFCSHDIFALGEWSDFYFKPIPEPRAQRMDHWSPFWPHGHITTDEVDQRSVAYIVKYCLKDMFNVVNSRGTARIAKAENNGAAMFRMSKHPPIGQRYLQAKLERLKALGTVPPKADVPVTGYSGFWWPRGPLRDWYLGELREINETHRAANGRDCPTWSSLLASLSLNEKDLDTLHGQQTQNQDTLEDLEQQIKINQNETAFRQRSKKERDLCGTLYTCSACFAGFSDETKAELKEWQDLQFRQADASGYHGTKAANRWFARQRRPNPFCLLADQKERFFKFGSY